MPDGGSVWVDILPDTRKFGPALKAELGLFAKSIKIHIPVKADTKKIRADLKSLDKEITKLGKRRASIRVDASTARALAELTRIESAIDRIDGRVAIVRVMTLGDTDALKALSSAKLARPETAASIAAAAKRKAPTPPRPFTDLSPAMSLAAWTLLPPVVPAVGALAGALGSVASGFAAAAAGAGAFALAAVPAIERALKATGELNYAQLRFHRSLVSVNVEWERFVDTTEQPVLIAVSEWTTTAAVGLRQLIPITRNTSGALTVLGREARKALHRDEWRLFFDFLNRQALPSTLIFGRSLGNLGLGLAGLLRNMEPLWNVVAPNLERLAANFAEWGNDTRNFTGFIQFMIDEGPKFVALFGALFDAAIDVGVALAPLGTVYAVGLTYLAQALSAVAEHAPFLLQLAVAVGTARVAFDLFRRVHVGIIHPIREAGEHIRNLGDRIKGVGESADGTARKTGRFRTALGSAVGVLGGPWGLAITAGIGLIGAFAAAKANATEKVREYTDAIRSDSGAIKENTRALAAKNLEQKGLLEDAERFGLSLELVTDAVIGEKNAMEQLNAAIDEVRQEYYELYGTSKMTEDQYTKLILQTADFKRAIEKEAEAVSEAVESNRRLEEATGDLAEAQNTLNGVVVEGTYQVDKLKAALSELAEVNLSAAESEIRYEQAVKRATDAVKENGATLDINTEAGQNNKQALIDLARAANDKIDAMERSGKAASEVTKIYDEQRKGFIKLAEQMGATGDEAEKLADDLLKIPTERNTKLWVNARGVFEVNNHTIWDTRRALGGMDTPGYGHMATGGPVIGPGTGTSDSIPVKLSHGEHVWTAKEVEMAGGHRAMYALRQAARLGYLNLKSQKPLHLARGGPVGDDIDIFGPAKVINDHREDVRIRFQQLIVELHKRIASRVARQLREYLTTGIGVVRAAVRWLGTPYSWGGGTIYGPSRGFGPGARTVGFDCSSLVQHAWWQGARVMLPRTTYEQIKVGTSVPKGQHMPGDLVFPHRGHVALVVNKNRLIHAPRTGVPVSYRSMYAAPIAIRRPKRRATGGRLDAGDWSWVGEHGPELIYVPHPAHVFSAEESARLVSDAVRVAQVATQGGATPLVGEYHTHIYDGEASVREAMREFDYYLRVLARRGGVHSSAP